jgi:hypothetical protein
MDLTAIAAILCCFIFCPIIVFTFIYFNLEGKRDIERRKLAKEMLELEIEKEKTHMSMLQAENEKYSHMIEEETVETE